MRAITSGFLVLLLTVSCYRSAPEPEFDKSLVIPADSMISLLSDIHLADGIINLNKDKKPPVRHIADEYFDAILKKHRINRDNLEESMRYYAYHTDELDRIYEGVITSLSVLESRVKSEQDTVTTAE